MTMRPLLAFSHPIVGNVRLVFKDQGLAHRRQPLLDLKLARRLEC
jgi:hypothetical protein